MHFEPSVLRYLDLFRDPQQVRDLVEKVYRLAESLVIASVQQELCTKFNEPFITPKIFMDYFNQVCFLASYYPRCAGSFQFLLVLLAMSTCMRVFVRDASCMRVFVRDAKLRPRDVNLVCSVRFYLCVHLSLIHI